MSPMNTGQIRPADRAAVLELVRRVQASDGVAPLSEQGLLHLAHGAREPIDGVRHLLQAAEPGPGVAAYAQLDARAGGQPAAELVVDPAHRRCGHGGALLDAVLASEPAVRVWSHGLLPGAGELAASRGMQPVRELLKLARALAPSDAFDTQVPQGYVLSTYDPDDPRDARDWLALNAAAFAAHPEQGRMTMADLRARQDESWFDAAGLFLVRDAAGSLAASHWTKVEDGVGEVYVVAVSPDHQGRGLGRAVTAVGLAHLRDLGLRTVELYVDGDNAAALATYAAQGFRTVTRDVQFAAGVSR
jgi:mycothiol synthase